MIKRSFCALLLAVMLIQAAPACMAQEYPAEVEQILRDSPVMMQDFLKMDAEALLGALLDPFVKAFRQPLTLGIRAVAYLLLAALISILLGGSDTAAVLETISALGFVVLCVGPLAELSGLLEQTGLDWHTYLCGFIPVFSGLTAASGQVSTAAVYDGLFLSLSGMVTQGIALLYLPFLRVYLCAAIACELWGNRGAVDAAAALYRCTGWLLKGLAVLAGGILGLQGTLAGIADQAAVQGAGAAFQVLVPVVGELAARAAAGVAAGLKLLRGMLAFAALGHITLSFVPLFAHCLGLMFCFRLMAVGAKGMGLSQCGAIADHFGNAAQLSLSVLILYFALVMLATILMLTIGGAGG